jgi:molecular chaperone IbpA|tara:strand:- start:140 stop:616 length:477 start_codon:yes stop_codon:yes gene_type:complete
MVTYDSIRKFDPFFVGADRLWRHVDDLHKMAATNQASNYPPYNIIKDDEDHYTIEMAVAGFTEEDLEVTLEDAQITVAGKAKEQDESKLLHRGIANRSFTRQFTLSDTIEIKGANLENGMLFIVLKNVIPDSKKPKKIEVTTRSKVTESKEEKELLTE